MTAEPNVTAMLAAIRDGDQGALDGLFTLLYNELHRLARAQLARRGGTPTLNTTVVVHETYLKLVGAGTLCLQDRSHFFALSARAMRQVVVQHARRRLAEKRGGDVVHTLLDEQEIVLGESAATVLGLDAALDRLHVLDERLAQVVELNFFAGLTHE
jgi:RNA polymerase sigma factor (TIGR02999 family)